jgi:predicted phosphate transport protein (TIGR00153 family)
LLHSFSPQLKTVFNTKYQFPAPAKSYAPSHIICILSALKATETDNMSSPFLKLFGKSPFKPLYDHMASAYDCTKELPEFLEAALAQDWEKANKIQQVISQKENIADDLKRQVRLSLPKNMFLPVDRSDLLSLVSQQDHLANATKDIAGLILGRKMEIPAAISDDFSRLVQRCLDAVKQAHKAIRELNDLYEAGFSGKEAGIIEEMVEKLHTIEHETDEMQIGLRRTLFSIEQELPPINVMFLYEVISTVGRLADYAQTVGDRLQTCIAR